MGAKSETAPSSSGIFSYENSDKTEENNDVVAGIKPSFLPPCLQIDEGMLLPIDPSTMNGEL